MSGLSGGGGSAGYSAAGGSGGAAAGGVAAGDAVEHAFKSPEGKYVLEVEVRATLGTNLRTHTRCICARDTRGRWLYGVRACCAAVQPSDRCLVGVCGGASE